MSTAFSVARAVVGVGSAGVVSGAVRFDLFGRGR